MESAVTARAAVSSLGSASAVCGLRLSRSKNEKVDMIHDMVLLSCALQNARSD